MAFNVFCSSPDVQGINRPFRYFCIVPPLRQGITKKEKKEDCQLS